MCSKDNDIYMDYIWMNVHLLGSVQRTKGGEHNGAWDEHTH